MKNQLEIENELNKEELQKKLEDETLEWEMELYHAKDPEAEIKTLRKKSILAEKLANLERQINLKGPDEILKNKLEEEKMNWEMQLYQANNPVEIEQKKIDEAVANLKRRSTRWWKMVSL